MVQEIRCTSCGASLEYSYGVDEIKCEHCGSTVVVDPYGHIHRPDYEGDVVRVLRTGKYVDAVKMVRHRSGLGLKESKQYVDSLAARNRIPISTGGSKMIIVAGIAILIMVGVAFMVFVLTT
jgi:LSD1 subclass zinc finger protein